MQRKYSRWTDVLLLFFLWPGLLQAQDELSEDHSSFFGARFGVLLSNNSIHKPSDAESPLLRSGLNLGLEGAWLPYRHLGIGGSLQYIGGEVEIIDGINSIPGTWVFPDTNLWRSFSLGIGPYFSLPFRNFSLETKLYAAYTFTRAHNKLITLRNANPKEERKLNLSNNAFSLQSGLTFRLDLKPGLSVALIYDHLMVFSTLQMERQIQGNPQTLVRESRPKVYHLPTLSLAFVLNIPHYLAY